MNGFDHELMIICDIDGMDKRATTSNRYREK